MKRVCYFYIIFFICHFFSASPSHSSTSYEYYNSDHKIGMDVVFGFSDTIKQGSNNQAVFFIKNDGKDFSGKLSVKVGSGYSKKGPYSIISKKIYLPGLSKKRIYLYFFYGGQYSNAQLIFDLVSDSGEVIFSTDIVEEKKIEIINSYPIKGGVAGFLTAVISDDNYGYNFLSGVNTEQPKTASVGGYKKIQGHKVVYPPYETLPDDSLGYDSVNLIVLADVSAGKLNYDQKKALIRYLYEGGEVLITKTDSNLWLKDEFMKEIMPCEFKGSSTTLNSIGGYSIKNAKAGKLVMPETLKEVRTEDYAVLDTLAKPDAQVLASVKGVPLIIRRPFGDSGASFFIAFDPSSPPYAGRKETLLIMGNIFNSFSFTRGIPLDYNYNYSIVEIFNSLMDSIMTKDIITNIVYFFLIVFSLYVLILGPINFFVLKRKKKFEYAWITIPVISIVFSTVFLVSGYAARGSENYIFTYNFIRVYDNSDFRVDSFLTVFASQAGSYDVDIERQSISAKHFDINRKNTIDNEIEISDVIKIKGVDINKWSVRNFTITGYIDNDSSYIAKAVRRKQGNYRIDNNLPFDIDKMFLLRGQQVYQIDLEMLEKNQEVNYGTKDIGYFDKLNTFSQNILIDSGNNGVGQTVFPSAYTRKSTSDLISYLRKKALLDTASSEFIIAVARAPAFHYELKGAKFNKTDKTIIIIPVEQR